MNLYSNIELFEDIFSPYMTGTIKMNESLNIPEVLPISGQETIEIEFKSNVENAEPITKMFRVYKLDRHLTDKQGKGQEYTLHLMSDGGIINYSQRCGYYVTGSVSEMVKTVVSKHFPSDVWENRFDVEKTNDNYSFVLPKSYTPFKSIAWLAGKAISSSAGDYSPFLFYETFDGYVFKSLTAIIKEGSSVVHDYYYTKENAADADGSPTSLAVDGPLSAVFHKVQTLEELSRFNMAENVMEGTISSKLAVHDLSKKEYREMLFREPDVFDATTNLGDMPYYKPCEKDDPIYFNNPCAYYYLPVTSFTVYDDIKQIKDNMKFEDYFLKRKYIINSMLTQKIVISVYGDSTKRVGQVINLYVPKVSADQAVQEEKKDKNLSGKYLITSIRHTFGKSYSCKMELSRNGMGV